MTFCMCRQVQILFLAYFPCFEKIKVGLYDQIALCLCISPTIVATQQFGKHFHAAVNTVTCYANEDAVRIVNWFYYNLNHT
jgi:hypothetical protein